MPKTPTEPISFDDVWNGFKQDYLPFVEWVSQPDDNSSFCIITFDENAPIAYKNKWSREQYKIKVHQDEFPKMLSGGKKLFIAIKEFMKKENKLLVDIGKVQIDRIGSGFETDYKVSKIK